MTLYSIEPRISKYVKGYGFLSYGTKLLNTATRTRLDAAKTASKKLAHKTAEATGEPTRNKIAKNLWNQNLCLMLIL